MAVELTDAAVAEIRRLKSENQLEDDYGLRVSVVRVEEDHQVALEIDQGPAPRDRSWTSQGVPIFCDRKSALLLGEVQVDHGPGGFSVRRLSAA